MTKEHYGEINNKKQINSMNTILNTFKFIRNVIVDILNWQTINNYGFTLWEMIKFEAYTCFKKGGKL